MKSIIIQCYENLGQVEAKTLAFIICTVITANIGLCIFKKMRRTSGEIDNTLAGIFFGAVSVLYSLILAFVIMAEWDDFNSLSKTIASESDKLNSIMAHSANLPDSIKITIRYSLATYCEQVIYTEWTMQERKPIDHPSAIPNLRSMLLTTMPANNLQESLLKVLDDDLSAVSDLRRDRLSHTHSQLPALVWGILETGAVILVVFCYFIQMFSAKLQRVYLSFFVCLLAMCLSIIYNLDHPFSPDSGLNDRAYRRVLSELPAY